MEIKIYNYLHDDCIKIRRTVFIEEQGFRDEFDKLDGIAEHIVIYDAVPVGNCRVYTENGEDYILGRLAVIKDFRGKGAGKALVEKAEGIALRKGGKSITLHSQCRAKEFYEKLGYTVFGEIDDDEGVPHVWMKKFIR